MYFMTKEIITREKFESRRKKWAEDLSSQWTIKKQAIRLLTRADSFNWIHQTNFFGEPSLQTPEDLLIFMDIVYKTSPDVVIELGIGWGGTMLALSTVLANGSKSVIGVDVFIPDDLVDRLREKTNYTSLRFVTGDSVDLWTFDKVLEIIDSKGYERVMVILDSYHTTEHVLKELELYAPLVTKGNFLVICDTIIDDMPPQLRQREWGPDNNPKKAMEMWFKNSRTADNFGLDTFIHNKLLMSCNTYLRRTT